MVITVLGVPDCPNVRLLTERIALAGSGLPITVRNVVVQDEATAGQWKMAGSPTMLIEGVDWFADGSAASISCRLYRDANGGVSGSPAVADLERVLRHWVGGRRCQ